MNRHYKRKLERLEKEIEKANKSENYILWIKLLKERNALVKELTEVQRVEIPMTLKNALKDYSPEERRELTTQIIMVVAIADILKTSTQDIEDKFREFGISSISICNQLRKISNSLADVIETIEKVNNEFFTQRYIEVVDDIEEHVNNTLKNYIFDEIHKINNPKK